jgi:hypothetical protein
MPPTISPSSAADRRRTKHTEFPDERPRRKGARPWRNRAIVYTLIKTGNVAAVQRTSWSS